MNPILIALIGMAVVVIGILGFRMHAFLALILATFAVTILTTKEQVFKYSANAYTYEVFTAADGRLELESDAKSGDYAWLRQQETGKLQKLGELTVIAGIDGRYSYQPAEVTPSQGDLLVTFSAYNKAVSESGKNWGERIAEGLGGTLTKIALLIAMASIIGKCLLDSGGAERIVASITKAVGEKRMPFAFIGSGFTLGIPVFFDTVFYLLIPLGKALRVRTGKNYLLYVLTIIAGGTMAHSLVPPTPGPLFVASELGIDIGLAMIAGLCLGIFTSGSGYLWALYANKRWEIPLRPSEDLPEAELEAIAQRDPATLPSLGLSLLPILLPVFLMGGSTAISLWSKSLATPNDFVASLNNVFSILGNKNIAMTIAAMCALYLTFVSKTSNKHSLKDLVQTALSSGGIIILITGAGGAFGHVLRQTGIAFTIQDIMPDAQSALIPLAFFICMLIRTAQGSATVAMITAVGIVSPLITAQDLGFHPIYIALAIGCGSKPISWMNDSGFWVISKMSGLTEREMLKTNTIMGICMAFTGLAICMIGAAILPLV